MYFQDFLQNLEEFLQISVGYDLNPLNTRLNG